MARHNLGQPVEPAREQRHGLRARSLLWPEHQRRAVGAHERRGDVGQPDEARREAPAPVELGELHERAAALGERGASGIPERPPEPPRRPRPPVHGGRAAEAHHDRVRPALDRLPGELAYAARRCTQRVALRWLQERDTARRGALEDCRLLVEPAQLSGDRRPEGPGDPHLLAQGTWRQYGVEEAVAAVGNRALDYRGVGERAPHAEREGVGHLPCPERSLERCRCHQD